MVLLDRAGKLRRVLNQVSGLRDETVWHTYVDRQGGLWLCLNDGLARVEVASPASYFDQTADLGGAVNSVARHRGRLYAATSKGVSVGQRPNPFEEVAFGELVREALEELAGPVAARGVAVEVAPELPPVYGDRTRLRQAVGHLLSNAVEHLGEQGEPRIEVGARDDGPEAVLFIRDNGRGIEAKYHEKVFGLFERLDPEASEGTGIGLALVKRIVEIHGGRIWVESEGRGRGSTFCFTLP